ncbi:MAG: molybdopterin-synthase adenylyltransferase MoeB [Proteobacteria bacterium]|nr:molybdopterin-synthase adenylyltransferase MoeB [Pseudomonadota bacterium]
MADTPALGELSDAQFTRYARHLILDEVGEEGQAKLLASRVLIVGAGGLGSPVALYLAAAGVGTLGLVDFDSVDVTNLQRQIVHAQESVGMRKVESAAATLRRLDPAIRVETHDLRVGAGNVDALVRGYDLVVDGSDNFATRYLVHDACYFAKKPLVSGALLRFEGQLSTFRAYDGRYSCYRCLFPTPPPADLIPRCEEAGILGSVAGVIGTLQATEVLKELLGLGTSLAGALLIYDALDTQFRRIKVPRDPACALCGDHPSIRPPA